MNIDTIKTNIRTTQTRSNPQKRYKAINDLIDALPEEILKEHYAELALLYQTFLPKAKTAKTPLQWVGLAQSKEAARPQLHHPYVSDCGKYVVATDGARLHLINNSEGYPAGRYVEKYGNLLTLNNTFPDWLRIFPEYETAPVELMVSNIREQNRRLIIDINDGPSLDKKYLDEATGGEDKYDDWLVQVKGDNDPVYFQHKTDGRQALIMPVRKKQ